MRSTSLKGRVSFVAIVGLLAVLVFAVTGCGGDGSDTTSGESTGGETTASGDPAEGGESVAGKKFAWVGCAPTVPYCVRESELVEELAKEEGLDYVDLSVSNFDPGEEAAHVSQALAQGAEVIGYEAQSPEAMRPVLQKAEQAEVPIIFVGNPPPGGVSSLVPTIVAPDYAAQGEAATESLFKGLEESGVTSGKILVVTGPQGEQSVEEYLDGIHSVFEGSKFEIAAEADSAFEPTKAIEVSQPLFAKFGSELVGAIGMTGPVAMGTVTAAEQAGRTVGTKSGDLIVVGMNCDATSLEGVESGVLYSTLSLSPTTTATATVPTAVKILKGETVPKHIGENPPVFTEADAAKFKEPCTY